MYISGYNINDYLNECRTMDLIDVVNDTQKELVKLNSMRTPKDSYSQYKFMEYRNFLGDFLSFLGGTPINIISERYRSDVKPVIQHFVDKGQLSENILKPFE